MTKQAVTETAAKKEPTLRVYPVTHDGKTRYIEAASPAAAIQFAFKPQIGTPLSANDVLALVRSEGVQAVEIIPKSETPAA